MAKGYWIVRVDVRDAENYKGYLTAAQPAYDKYGAKFLVRGGTHVVTEGEARARNVVIEFDSYQAALDCYHSEEYQQAAKIRQTYADSDFLIIEGYQG